MSARGADGRSPSPSITLLVAAASRVQEPDTPDNPDNAVFAAHAVLPHVAELGRGLFAFAEIDDAGLAAYEAEADAVLVACPFGQFWLCPTPPPHNIVLTPDAPWTTVRALRELGRALADVVAENDAALGANAPPLDAGAEAASNDFGDDDTFEVPA